LRSHTRKSLEAHIKRMETAVLWPSDISSLLREHRSEWGAPKTSGPKAVESLLDAGLLQIAEFESARYGKITRYLRGKPSKFALALALRRESFICHHSALEIHKLGASSNVVYVNQEQSSKAPGGDLTQASIRQAFKNKQRQSNYRFSYGEHAYVLISGKDTGRAGVTTHKTDNGELLDVTDLERTLIDIVVRPAYAGGIEKVASIYRSTDNKIKVDHLLKILEKLDYVYPYQQSLGFLLERAGYPEADLKKLERIRSGFDFFLDYDVKKPEYDERWHLYYPARLK
jgi:hypothetical protein